MNEQQINPLVTAVNKLSSEITILGLKVAELQQTLSLKDNKDFEEDK